MELAFRTKKIRQLCEDENQAKKILGNKNAEILKHRLADLCAATNIYDMITGNPRVFEGKNEQQYKIDISSKISINFCANHINNPMLKSGKINWSKISRIKIMMIGDNNV